MEANTDLRQEGTLSERPRHQFLKEAGLAGGAAFLALAATANPFGEASAFAKSSLAGLTDLDILNFALTLEHLEAAFYGQVITSGKFSDKTLRVLRTIHNHEVAHVAALTATIQKLGGTPVAAMTTYHFGDMSSAEAILKTAEALEMTGVGAYTGASGLITNRAALIPAAGGIEQVEARHYATIRMLRNEDPAPAAFGPILTPAQVLKAVNPILGKM